MSIRPPALEVVARKVSILWPLLFAATTLVSGGAAFGAWNTNRRIEGKLDRALEGLAENAVAHREIGSRIGLVEVAIVTHSALIHAAPSHLVTIKKE